MKGIKKKKISKQKLLIQLTFHKEQLLNTTNQLPFHIFVSLILLELNILGFHKMLMLFHQNLLLLLPIQNQSMQHDLIIIRRKFNVKKRLIK